MLRGRVRRDGYRLLPYTHDFGAALAAADLALARAGGSVYELAAAGTPAVLVPYPHATADHQTKNARHFADAGAAVARPRGRRARRAGSRQLAARRPRPAREDGGGHAAHGAGRTPPRRSQTRCSRLPALDGRKLWFVGIGGAGMSALAVVTRAWGAEVAGWDRHETPYLDQLDGRGDRDLAVAALDAGGLGAGGLDRVRRPRRRGNRGASCWPSSCRHDGRSSWRGRTARRPPRR